MTASRAVEPAPLTVQSAGGVAVVTLNRPSARNALSTALLHALGRAMADADAADDVGVIVLTGADPAFCAGLDLKEMAAGGGNLGLGASPDGQQAAAPWSPTAKPVIASVNGVAVTGGLELVLHCDIVIASERAAFADTHARVGVMPGWGMSVLLPLAVGPRVARQMSLTGDYLTAEQALRFGLVSEVVAHDELPVRTRVLATTIAGNNRTAVRALLATYRRIDADRNAQGLRTEAAASRAWLDQEFDAVAVAKARTAVMDRGRGQPGAGPLPGGGGRQD